MEFKKEYETARFLSPLQNFAGDAHLIEKRWDPLTGRTSILSHRLAEKARMFFGNVDRELLQDLVASSAANCFFCPDKIYSMTPLYPEELAPGGRLKVGRAIVFPNLFPLAKIHAVITIPEFHFLSLEQFDSAVVKDYLQAGVEFCRRAAAVDGALRFLSINCNHLPPAGASLVHTHFQVYGGELLPGAAAEQLSQATHYAGVHGQSFWQDLIETEQALGERYIAAVNGVHWLTTFAPIGANEVIGIVPDCECVTELNAEQVDGLAEGIAAVLNYYSHKEMCSFNLTLFSGLLDHSAAGACVHVRLISRQNLYKNYRNDDYFLQKLLSEELIILPPEARAKELLSFFKRPA